MMISYAQNAEDVLLRRIFSDHPGGFYIDVGACDPVSCSITKHFYDLGWHGINVDASPAAFARVAPARPRDINLNVGVSNREGEMTFYEFPPQHAGLSTFSEVEAREHQKAGRSCRELPVPVTTLARLCEQHAVKEIDFMSIDVEGHEREVLEGANLRSFRPRVVLVEATRPLTTITSHDRWEHLLLDADYLYATFDGLNRYYVRSENREDVARLAAPANIFDEYIPYTHWQQLEELRAEVERAREGDTPFIRAARLIGNAARSLDGPVQRARRLLAWRLRSR
jgi:FkbM family methyltransferase